ncbi:MAG: hypothetical protein GX025_10595 [Clostridiales bacterium]|nr:hypothetical protein [Clostridiales bacterium]
MNPRIVEIQTKHSYFPNSKIPIVTTTSLIAETDYHRFTIYPTSPSDDFIDYFRTEIKDICLEKRTVHGYSRVGSAKIELFRQDFSDFFVKFIDPSLPPIQISKFETESFLTLKHSAIVIDQHPTSPSLELTLSNSKTHRTLCVAAYNLSPEAIYEISKVPLGDPVFYVPSASLITFGDNGTELKIEVLSEIAELEKEREWTI